MTRSVSALNPPTTATPGEPSATRPLPPANVRAIESDAVPTAVELGLPMMPCAKVTAGGAV
jgi:hypothetical protein